MIKQKDLKIRCICWNGINFQNAFCPTMGNDALGVKNKPRIVSSHGKTRLWHLISEVMRDSHLSRHDYDVNITATSSVKGMTR